MRVNTGLHILDYKTRKGLDRINLSEVDSKPYFADTLQLISYPSDSGNDERKQKFSACIVREIRLWRHYQKKQKLVKPDRPFVTVRSTEWLVLAKVTSTTVALYFRRDKTALLSNVPAHSYIQVALVHIRKNGALLQNCLRNFDGCETEIDLFAVGGACVDPSIRREIHRAVLEYNRCNSVYPIILKGGFFDCISPGERMLFGSDVSGNPIGRIYQPRRQPPLGSNV